MKIGDEIKIGSRRGDIVKISYDPKHPKHAFVNYSTSGWDNITGIKKAIESGSYTLVRK